MNELTKQLRSGKEKIVLDGYTINYAIRKPKNITAMYHTLVIYKNVLYGMYHEKCDYKFINKIRKIVERETGQYAQVLDLNVCVKITWETHGHGS